MKIIDPYFKISDGIDGAAMLGKVESAGRVCYKSENLAGEDSAEKFVAAIIRNGHESVLEHEKISALIVCDRGVSHEIVRHRIASYSQESTRYCNYSKGKFGGELTFIRPCYWAEGGALYELWEKQMAAAEECYLAMLEAGASPQEARAVLPNSLKTEIVVTMNLREWRHFFSLRADEAAHPQMRQIALPLREEMRRLVPVVFD
ncbi:MAG: FAD-dependent thymidylate synthase [Clostridiales bacterium]|jgi:thymidylate synthase (FAD)|nr:FAD-dependent thymidylate synthase [Clostridiales bacterium]